MVWIAAVLGFLYQRFTPDAIALGQVPAALRKPNEHWDVIQESFLFGRSFTCDMRQNSKKFFGESEWERLEGMDSGCVDGVSHVHWNCVIKI